jgi:hypothetical protein
VHFPTEDKSDDTKDNFYEEPERVLDQFLKYHMKILLGDFNANVRRKDNADIVKSPASSDLIIKSTMLPRRKVHKYTWTSPDRQKHNQINLTS